jgi:hypothetical protein
LEFSEADRAGVVDLCRRNEIRWGRVYSTARLHGVAPLVYSNLARFDQEELGLENGVLERFRQSFANNLVAMRRLREGLWEILGFFNQRHLDVMLIKGAAHNLFHNGASHYAVSRDVDLIIRARRDELPEALLAEINQLANGFPLEFDFYGHHDIDMNGVLEIDYDRVWADAIPRHYAGRDFYLMSPEDALIAACINACRKRYFSLKALCSIDELLEARSSIRWDNFVEKARDYRVGDIVFTALRVTEMLRGSTVPSELAGRLVSSDVRKALIEALVNRVSFSSLSSLYSGRRIACRNIGVSLLLPYASYKSDQMWRKLKTAANGASAN